MAKVRRGLTERKRRRAEKKAEQQRKLDDADAAIRAGDADGPKLRDALNEGVAMSGPGGCGTMLLAVLALAAVGLAAAGVAVLVGG